jgi:hypothetical protein
MLLENENKLDFLKQVLIFNEFTEDELVAVAELLNTEFVKAGAVIFSRDDDRKNVYIIRKGEVRVTRREEDGAETVLANFYSGDILGEDALVYNRTQPITTTALTDIELYYLSEEDLNWVKETYPQVEPYLIAITQTYETIRRLKIDWLNEDETISLVAKRHPISMLIEIIATAFLVSLTLTVLIAFITFLDDARVITMLSAGVAGLITLVGLIASIWSFFEWRNDLIFVTNHRVVWRERILFRSSSRQEVPLRTIQSLNIQTPNVLARMIDVGDLIVRTFNSEMKLTDVNHPERLKNMIDSFLRKAQRKSVRTEHATIRQTIRRQLGYDEEATPDEVPAVVPLDVQENRQRLGLFTTRIVEDGTITYRKHWWVFFKGAWKSILAFIASILASFGLSAMVINTLGVLGLVALYLIPFCIFLWWLYQYEDWRNDIYRVSKDRIIDRDKKPLGKESFRSAPVANIQSVGHEIPNTIGLILNVGNVTINVGEETLSFNGVHDPALVHQDISRCMEELAAEKERVQSEQEHDRMAAWIDIYHEETKGKHDTGLVEQNPDFD